MHLWVLVCTDGDGNEFHESVIFRGTFDEVHEQVKMFAEKRKEELEEDYGIKLSVEPGGDAGDYDITDVLRGQMYEQLFITSAKEWKK